MARFPIGISGFGKHGGVRLEPAAAPAREDHDAGVARAGNRSTGVWCVRRSKLRLERSVEIRHTSVVGHQRPEVESEAAPAANGELAGAAIDGDVDSQDHRQHRPHEDAQIASASCATARRGDRDAPSAGGCGRRSARRDRRDRESRPPWRTRAGRARSCPGGRRGSPRTPPRSRRDEVWILRSRPDEAHLAAEHVPELRQLVELRPGEESTDAREAWVDVAGEGMPGGAVVHLAELEHAERATAPSDACRAVEDRPAALELDRRAARDEDTATGGAAGAPPTARRRGALEGAIESPGART